MPREPAEGRQLPHVSIVIAVRNGAATLPALFEALDRQTAPADWFEVIVVDDASDDDTQDIVERSRARLISATTHVGLPSARNLGIREARGDVVALTDADCIPSPTWLERGWAQFASGGVDILAGGITVPLGDHPSIASLLDSSRFFDQERWTAEGCATGANLWVHRRVFQASGLFNEGLAAYGGDDEDFTRRATRDGARLIYVPDVAIAHPPRRRLRQLARKAYRLGYGHATQRRHALTSVRGMRKLFLNPRMYIPRRRIYRVERLAQRGIHPAKWQLGLMHLAQYFCVQLPRVAGDLAGELAYRRTSADP